LLVVKRMKKEKNRCLLIHISLLDHRPPSNLITVAYWCWNLPVSISIPVVVVRKRSGFAFFPRSTPLPVFLNFNSGIEIFPPLGWSNKKMYSSLSFFVYLIAFRPLMFPPLLTMELCRIRHHHLHSSIVPTLSNAASGSRELSHPEAWFGKFARNDIPASLSGLGWHHSKNHLRDKWSRSWTA
jgi:hypothetical protein